MYLHLTQLKNRILVAEMAGATRYDTRLSMIASGVCDAFDLYTGRKLVREVGRVEYFDGARSCVFLDCYPVEEITTLEIRFDKDDAFETLDYGRLSTRSGIVHLGAYYGGEATEIKATYTGGYWVDTSAGYDGTKPDEATALPDSILNAWCLQVDHEARIKKVFGGTKDENVATVETAEIELLPRVRDALNTFRKLS